MSERMITDLPVASGDGDGGSIANGEGDIEGEC